MINVLVNHIRCKMIIKKKKKRLIKVNTKDGKVLYLVEPGYFFNEDVFLIYSQIEDEIEYEDLKSWMMSHYFGGSEIIELKLNSTLKLLKDKNLIEYQDKNYSKSNIMVKKEVDLVDEYDFYPITQIDIIITKTCNYNCKHCFINFENDVEVSFDCDKWIDICDKLIGRGLQSVVITGGEPLTIDYLSKLIIFLTRKGVRIMLLSNGYLIDKKFIEEILPYKSLITIQISLDGSSEESHDYQRNKKGSFQKTINNIKLLTDKGFKVVLAMVVSEVNYNDIIDGSMFNLAKDLDVLMLGITTSIIMTGNAKTSNLQRISQEKTIEIVKFVHNYDFDDTFPKVVISGPPSLTPEKSVNNLDIDRPRCRRGINSFAIRPDGNVVTCSDFAEINYNEYNYGNVFKDELDDIIGKASKIQKKIMERYKKIKGICSICKELRHCGGACRADSYAKYGDILSPYPLCQIMYEKGLFPKEMIDYKRSYKLF